MDTEQRTGSGQPDVMEQPDVTEQPGIVEWGGAGGPGWLASGRGVALGAGFGCALAGFALLLAAELLPWVSIRTTAVQQDFPTAAGGRIEYGLAELSAYSEMFNFGWLIVFAAVATALVVRPPVRRVVVAAGLGLAAGQLALLAGLTRGVKQIVALRGGATPLTSSLAQLGTGVYCAYLALVLVVAALLLAGGVRARRRPPVDPADGPAFPGPADLTVTPVPADPQVWSRVGGDIEVGGQPPAR